MTTHQDVKDATAQTEATMRPQSVPVNMYETSEAVVVVAPLPAVRPDDVCVEVRNGSLRFWSHVRSAGNRIPVLILSALHGLLAKWRKDFARDANTHSPRFYRIVNEIPAALMVVIVILAVVKPF